jgi:DNA-binding NtrC family response regulator
MDIPRDDGQALAQDIECALRSDVNVLITGGDPHLRIKLARMIYEATNSRRSHPLVHVRPAETVLSPLQLESPASDGTLLIEEVGTLSLVAQLELGRLLEQQIPTRVIATTAHDLFAATDFDPGLFYRLNTIHLVLSHASRFTA